MGKQLCIITEKLRHLRGKEENYDTEAKFDFAIDGKIIKIK
jgi:hypothetical protein